jgi:hypothetical protein
MEKPLLPQILQLTNKDYKKALEEVDDRDFTFQEFINLKLQELVSEGYKIAKVKMLKTLFRSTNIYENPRIPTAVTKTLYEYNYECIITFISDNE